MAEGVHAELGFGPLLDLWALWCAAAVLLATELPLVDRVAAAALGLRALPAWGRGRWGSRRCARLLPPAGHDTHWRLAIDGRWQALRLGAAGKLAGGGWLLRFGGGGDATWVWVDASRLDHVSGRRLRAAITAGRT